MKGMADVRAYALITGAYWGFTLTDGALRMLVLLHFHTLGYSPLQIATLFLFYEFFGVVTNLTGGWLGARFGLRVTLFGGLAIQIGALLMLAALDPGWTLPVSVAYVMAAQALSGIAKDLTKMSSKSAIKLVLPEDAHNALFRWVALLTGSKNALKGAGFFLGGLLLAAVGFVPALWAMSAALGAVLVGCVLTLPYGMGKSKAKPKFTRLFSTSREINVLSAARFFLFGSRDTWFVVGLPVFLYTALGWDFEGVGGFLALWVIGYGAVQAATPAVVRLLRLQPSERTVQGATFALALAPAGIALALGAPWPAEAVVTLGLTAFALMFAFNSSIHSYLIVAYSDRDRVSENVGFYYMANAGGRLAGTVLSGWTFQLGGLQACLWTSALFVLAAGACSLLLPSHGLPAGEATLAALRADGD
jgi:predicted MFS family arabinose efflux permease